MRVSVVVPYRPDGAHRDLAWTWVQWWWGAYYPRWQIVAGSCGDGPWRKATAVADAVTRADGDLLVVADADAFCDGVGEAVAAVAGGAPWAVPHDKVRRLSRDAAALVYAGHTPKAAERVRGLDRQPYTGVIGGGLVVLPRATYETAPLDPRFQGWGEEDLAWGLTLTCIAGKPWRGTAGLWHLWHPPQPRLNAHVGNPTSHALHVRYQVAARSRSAMRNLIAEHREAPSGHETAAVGAMGSSRAPTT